MASVQEILDTQRTIEESISLRMTEFEEHIKSAAIKDNKLTLDQLTLDYKAFKETVLSIFQMLRSVIQTLTLQVEDLDCYNRRNALLFSGMEESDKEDCKALVLGVIQSKMNFKDVPASSIGICHRLGTKNESRNRPILVRFTDCNIRNTIWNEKKRLKSSSTVLNEFLTKTRQDIFSKARKHFGIARCWTRYGNVIVKLPNNVRQRIATSDELMQLMADFPLPNVSEHQTRLELPKSRRNAAKKTAKKS